MDSDSDSSGKITAVRKKVVSKPGKAAGPAKGAAKSSSDSDDEFDLVAAAKSSRAKQVQSGRADQPGSPSRPISRTTSAKAGSSGDKSFVSRPPSPVKAGSPQLARQNTGPRQQQQQQRTDSESDSDFELLTAVRQLQAMGSFKSRPAGEPATAGSSQSPIRGHVRAASTSAAMPSPPAAQTRSLQRSSTMTTTSANAPSPGRGFDPSQATRDGAGNLVYMQPAGGPRADATPSSRQLTGTGSPLARDIVTAPLPLPSFGPTLQPSPPLNAAPGPGACLDALFISQETNQSYGDIYNQLEDLREGLAGPAQATLSSLQATNSLPGQLLVHEENLASSGHINSPAQPALAEAPLMQGFTQAPVVTSPLGPRASQYLLAAQAVGQAESAGYEGGPTAGHGGSGAAAGDHAQLPMSLGSLRQQELSAPYSRQSSLRRPESPARALSRSPSVRFDPTAGMLQRPAAPSPLAQPPSPPARTPLPAAAATAGPPDITSQQKIHGQPPFAAQPWHPVAEAGGMGMGAPAGAVETGVSPGRGTRRPLGGEPGGNRDSPLRPGSPPWEQGSQAAAAAQPGPSIEVLGQIVQQSVTGAMQDLRSDIQHLEAAWAGKWQEQAAATASLQARVDGSGQEVNTRLEGILGELAAQRQRLDKVEEAQANSPRTAVLAQPPAPPTQLALEAAAVTCNPIFESKPVSPTGSSASLPPGSPALENTGNVKAIMQRIDLLENRVQAQITQLDQACRSPSPVIEHPPAKPASPHSSSQPQEPPSSPALNATERGAEFGWSAETGSPARVHVHCRPGMTQVAVVNTVAPLVPPLPRPSSHNAANATCQQLFADIGAGGLVHSSPHGGPSRLSDIPSRPAATPSRLTVSACSGSSSAGGRVDRQVAETQRLIAGIQEQIAQIKGSLSDLGSSGRVEQEGVGRRLVQLEQSHRVQQGVDKYKAFLGQAQAEQAVELARRVRALEGKVATLQQRANDSGVDLPLRVGALEWRLDKSSGASLDTLKTLERRQDRLCSQLAGVRDTSAAANTALSGEMARLSRKVAAHCVTARPLFRNY